MSAATPADQSGRRRLLYALGASALFHLSAVTIFKIVVYFPIQEVRYYELKFVETPVAAGEAATDASLARWERLPRLEPPRLFDEDYRLSLSGGGVDAQSLYQEVFGAEQEEERGPLSGLEEGLRNIQTTFGQLRLREDRMPFEETAGARQEFSPASGFNGTLTWPNRDTPRMLLFSPPLQALWEVDPRLMERGIQFQLSVDAEGKVTRVWRAGGGAGPVAQVESQLMQYRFEPEENGAGIDETAMVIITPAADDAAP